MDWIGCGALHLYSKTSIISLQTFRGAAAGRKSKIVTINPIFYKMIIKKILLFANY